MNLNDNIVITYDYKYLEHMIAEKVGLVTEIKSNLISALEELEDAKNIQDNPQTFKAQLNWFGRKIKIINDPISDRCSEAT